VGPGSPSPPIARKWSLRKNASKPSRSVCSATRGRSGEHGDEHVVRRQQEAGQGVLAGPCVVRVDLGLPQRPVGEARDQLGRCGQGRRDRHDLLRGDQPHRLVRRGVTQGDPAQDRVEQRARSAESTAVEQEVQPVPGLTEVDDVTVGE